MTLITRCSWRRSTVWDGRQDLAQLQILVCPHYQLQPAPLQILVELDHQALLAPLRRPGLSRLDVSSTNICPG